MLLGVVLIVLVLALPGGIVGALVKLGARIRAGKRKEGPT